MTLKYSGLTIQTKFEPKEKLDVHVLYSMAYIPFFLSLLSFLHRERWQALTTDCKLNQILTLHYYDHLSVHVGRTEKEETTGHVEIFFQILI